MALPKLPERLYRTSLVRMYYAKAPSAKTPNPFCEMRAWIISNKPVSRIWLRRLNAELDWLSFVMKGTSSLKFRQKLLDGSIRIEIAGRGTYRLIFSPEIYYETVGSEFNRKIDLDEAVGRPGEGLAHGCFASTGLPPEEWELYQVYRYVCFFDSKGRIKAEYNEADIRQMEPTAERDYNTWVRYMIADELFRERYMKWILAWRGIAWNPKWRVAKPYIWRGRPVFTVRDEKGRFVKGSFLIGRPVKLTKRELELLGR